MMCCSISCAKKCQKGAPKKKKTNKIEKLLVKEHGKWQLRKCKLQRVLHII